MIPTIGRIVHYRLSAMDVVRLDLEQGYGRVPVRPIGTQAHIGNDVKEGDTFPMMIVRVWGDAPDSAVNGQVFLDGPDVLWVASVSVGEGPRTFSWPVVPVR